MFFKTKYLTEDKEGHYITIKGSIQEEDIALINTYTPNTGAPNYTKQILTDIEEEIDNNIIILGDFNTSLTSVDISSIPNKINKETVVLHDTLD